MFTSATYFKFILDPFLIFDCQSNPQPVNMNLCRSLSQLGSQVLRQVKLDHRLTQELISNRLTLAASIRTPINNHLNSSCRFNSIRMASTFKKLQVARLTHDFDKATEVVEVPKRPPQANEALLKVLYVGINATDVNISAGRYFAPDTLPFDIGFEAVVKVEALGDSIKTKLAPQGIKEGSSAIYFGGKAYTEYVYLNEDELASAGLFPIPEPNPDYLTFIVSGLTSTIGLDVVSKFK